MWDSVHRLADMPAMITLSMRCLRICSTRSLLSGPNTLCGLVTTVSPSSMCFDDPARDAKAAAIRLLDTHSS